MHGNRRRRDSEEDRRLERFGKTREQKHAQFAFVGIGLSVFVVFLYLLGHHPQAPSGSMMESVDPALDLDLLSDDIEGPPKLVVPQGDPKKQASTPNVEKDDSSDPIAVFVTVMAGTTNTDNSIFSFDTLVETLCKHTKEKLNFYLVVSPETKDSVSQILRDKCQERIESVHMYDWAPLETLIREKTGKLQEFFTSGGKFAHPLFFLEIMISEFMPPDLEKIIVLDVDLEFRTDIRELQKQFSNFGKEAVMGLAYELQPVYRHVLSLYRSMTPGTELGGPPQTGFPGYNSGVLLINLATMRTSSLYQSIFSTPIVKDLTSKYKFSGHLGDQDLYTLLAIEHRELFYTLPCQWNRQLCQWWRNNGYADVFDEYYSCSDPVFLYHKNCGTQVPNGK